MKNRVFTIVVLAVFTFNANLFPDAQRKSDCERFRQVIEELENELIRVTNLRDYYDNAWVVIQVLPWDYQIRLDERKIKILKDIYYFKNLLALAEHE